MDAISIFFKSMEKLIEEYPDVYFNVQRVRTGKIWRIQIFGKNQGIIGDSELMHVEEAERDTAFYTAINKMDKVRDQIHNLLHNPRRVKE